MKVGTKYCYNGHRMTPSNRVIRKRELSDGTIKNEWRCVECQRSATRSPEAKVRAAKRAKEARANRKVNSE